MKQTTCLNLKGACGEIITGNTPEEMGDNCKQHVMKMMAKGDKAHMDAVNAMKNTTHEDFSKWFEDFKLNFDKLQDA